MVKLTQLCHAQGIYYFVQLCHLSLGSRKYTRCQSARYPKSKFTEKIIHFSFQFVHLRVLFVFTFIQNSISVENRKGNRTEESWKNLKIMLRFALKNRAICSKQKVIDFFSHEQNLRQEFIDDNFKFSSSQREVFRYREYVFQCYWTAFRVQFIEKQRINWCFITSKSFSSFCIGTLIMTLPSVT